MKRKNLTIPECRSMLQVIAREVDKTTARRIRFVVGHMKRRKPVRITPPVSPPLTPALARRIRRVAYTTSFNQQKIAALFGVSSGRVSEALAGKRR